MKKIIFLFLFIFAISVAQAQSTAYVDTTTYNDDMSLVADNFDSLEQKIAQAEYKDWNRYWAGWHYRLIQTRALFRAMGVDSVVADSLARRCLVDHKIAEKELTTAYQIILSKMKSMDGRLSQAEKNIKRHDVEISTLAQGFLAEHGKNVSNRGDKKKKARAEIERILNRYLQQEGGIEQWKKSRIP